MWFEISGCNGQGGGRYAHVGYISRERLQARRVQDGIKKEMGGAGYTRRIKVRKE